MQTRRIYLEVALEKSIEANDFDGFSKLFELMRELCIESTTVLDSEGWSFLYKALFSGATEIAYKLVDLQRFNDAIIFAKNIELNTLLHLAVEKGNYKIVKKLLGIAEDRKKMELFLSQDYQGFTVLHIAAQLISQDADKIMNLLLMKIAPCSDLKSFINLSDKSGKTALEYAMETHANKRAIILMNAGATLTIFNKNNKPLFQFSDLPLDKQTDLFLSLDDNQKKFILKLYSLFLDEITITNKINKNYIKTTKNNLFTLAGLHSLKTLLVYYHKYHHNEFEINIESDDLKVIEETQETIQNTIQNMYKNVLLENDLREKDIADREELSALITMIEDFQSSLNSRWNSSPILETMRYTYIFSCLIFYISMLIWLSIRANQSLRQNTNDHYILYAFCFGGFGWIPPLLGGFFSTEQKIMRSEWEPKLDQLKTGLLDKLLELEKRDALENTELLPTNSEKVLSLQTDINDLKQNGWTIPLFGWRVHSFWSPISKVKSTFANLHTTTTSIRRDVITSNKPISQKSSEVKENTVIDIDYSNEKRIIDMAEYSSDSENNKRISRDDSEEELLCTNYKPGAM